jgi:hypothetical protein
VKYLFAFILCFGAWHSATAQQTGKEVIQFSGIVVTEERGEPIPVPYTNVYLKSRKRGTVADAKGFFSFVAEKGDKIVFSAIGFKTIELTIPDTLHISRYSVVQIMSQDTMLLPETVIYPWPNRDHFKQEFLAMDISNELSENAAENVAEKHMKQMRKQMSYDGKENSQYYLRQQANKYYTIGQFQPMNIFSPNAWAQFVNAWKKGDFKRKKDE